ncbi:flavodoxin domain-containing protein [Roseovarius salis]|uniref:flavodoxin domain-containing protein n=1 Tax=Roseovarius salis TaxID=3376063 RepID=UPI0037C6A9A1
MKLLVGYATSEGQTRRIARHVADRLAGGGNVVELLNLSEAEDIELDRFDRVIIAASLHVGHYQRCVSEFAAARAETLNRMPTLFLSVSLAAAGHEADDWKALDRILAEFTEATGWTPGRVAQVAGAYAPSRYDVFRRFIMRRIIAAKDPGADPDADHEYTDWAALDAALDDWLGT